jgi:hypothetical protein
LLAFGALVDMERVDRLLARGDELRRAFLVNHAFAAPDELTKAFHAHERALGTPAVPQSMTIDRAKEIAARMEAKARTANWSEPKPLGAVI